ncbi:MAG: DHH family phosphoesterase [Candidatus Micrarchaeota archaeon]
MVVETRLEGNNLNEIAGRIVFKNTSSTPDYVLLTPDGYIKVKQENSESDFDIGELVEAKGELGNGVLHSQTVEKIKDKKLEGEIDAFLEKNSQPKTIKHLIDGEGLDELEKSIENMARVIAGKMLDMTPVKIRFNDDCDGISSGLLVEDALVEFAKEHEIPIPHGFIRDKQCNSAVYDLKQADADCIEARAYAKKSLLVLLDFGANEESIPALEKASDDFDIAIIDHHSFSQKAVSLTNAFLSPMTAKHGSSSHTTGLMAFEFACALNGKADEKLAWFSLQSDKSVFRKKTEMKEPVVLDYLAGDHETLSFYRKTLADPAGIAFQFAQAQAKLRNAFEKALKQAKPIEVGKAKLIITPLAGIVEKNSFPPKGKVLNEIQKHFEGPEGEKLVASVGYDGTTVQFRVSRALHAAGFKSTDVIKEIAKLFPISGGGHEQASAMRFQEDLAAAIVEKTIELCKNKISEATENG